MTEGTWLYAVTRSGKPGSLDGLTGVAGESLRVIEAAGFTAVVGSVPLDTFGDEALRRNLEDLDWLGQVARAHDTVVAALARSGPTAPLRLATVYHDDERVAQVLAERAGEFGAALDRVTGRTEWGVKARVDPSRLREPEPAGARGSGRGAGAAYLQRRRAQLSTREHGEQFAAETAERIHTTLAAHAADARRHRPQSRQLSGDPRPMMLNAAYLVDDERTREFAEAVAECNEIHDAIEVELTGPWPPYSFTSLENP